MDQQSSSEEVKKGHKVPLFDDFQQLAVIRATRQVGKQHDTESTEATPAPSPRTLMRADVPDLQTWEQLFRIRNLMTGEELDLRDENEESFGHRFAGLIDREHHADMYEQY